jgi:hypothetical protein
MKPENENFQARGWFNELKFYEREIHNCERSLEEVLQRASNVKDQARAEHFQNQFILQRLHLQRLWKQLREVLSLPDKQQEAAYAKALDYRRFFKQLLQEFDQFLHEYFAIPQLKV